MRPAWKRRLREAAPSALLAVVIYVPLLLTKPGWVGADTKTYLYLDPGRLLERAPSMWDPNIGMGTVTHQNIGYLWPIGPWYWLADAVGMPDWLAQRLWLGTILFLAGLGVRFMLKALGQEGPHVTAATFCYALTPYVLSLGARLSVILLPYAGLPWLIGLAVFSLRRGGWRYPALFGLVVTTVGSVNATALILAGVGPVLWILHEVVVTRDARTLDALKTVGRIGVMSLGCSLWWIAGLWAQRGYGIEILRYTETAETVATASLSLEVLRGLGYWFFYGDDRFGPWIAPSRTLTQRVDVLLLTYVLPGLGLVGAATTRFRERTFFLLLLTVGLFLAVGAHPWDDPSPAGTAVKAFLESDLGLSMRSLPRAAPLVVLSLSVFVGTLVAALSRQRPRLARPLTAGVMVLAVLGLPALWRGQMVDDNLQRPEELPAYWLEAAAALDARDDGTRVLEIPGSDFASYRWGTTVDPITPGLMDRPYVARELIPYGSPASADLLNAVDRRLQEQVAEPEAIAPLARLMGVGDLAVRSDLTYERYNTPRPRRLWDVLMTAPGLGAPIGFGGTEPNQSRPNLPLLDEQELLTSPDLADPPKVGIVPVDDAEAIVRTAAADQPVVLAGNGEGIVDLASAELISGHELLLYSGTFADDPDGFDQLLDDDAVLVLTDTNRRQAQRWGTVRDNTGITERAGQTALRTDPKDQRLEIFPEAGDDSFTVTESRGGVWALATSYGNAVSLTPEADPVNAVDGNPGTAWRIGGFSSATDETISLRYRFPVTTDRLDILQAIGGVRNRFITEVELRFDGGEPLRVTLDDSSRSEEPGATGQTISIGRRTFDRVDITVTATDPGNLKRYSGVSAVGFAEIVVTDESGLRPVAEEVIRLPTDLLDLAGESSMDHELAVVLTRQRVAGAVAVRSDPEPFMARTFALPDDRSFHLVGEVRISNAATDPVIDQMLGLPNADNGGVTATSRRRLPGGVINRSMSAIDGDPDTWYSPGFLDQRNEFVDYTLAEPITFDRMDLTVLNDGRHSVPRVLDLAVDDKPVQRIELPDIADQPEPNARHTFPVTLDQAVTGTRVTLTIADTEDAVRAVDTIDWFSDRPLATPMGIVELGIEGLAAPPLPAQIDPACRSDLVEIDGQPLSVSVRGTTEELLAGAAVDLVACNDEALDVTSGEPVLRTTAGSSTGLDLDRLVLRSGAGGAADRSGGLLVDADDAERRPELTITDESRVHTDLVVPDAGDEFWVVLGQSYSSGWTATANGEDLGAPTLVNGYANGWRVPPGEDIEIRIEWTPQRVVRAMIGASALFVVLALALAFWPRGRRPAFLTASSDTEAPRWIPLDQRPSMPLAWSWERVRRYRGPAPSLFALVATTIAAAVAGFAFVGPLAAAVMALCAAISLRVASSRPILTAGAPLLFVGAVLWMAVRQFREDLPPGFEWPTYFEGAHDIAWIAVLLLLLDAVVDRCWLRRWWPSNESD